MRGGDPAVSRSEIVRAARSWIGTPYHHQASLRGIGTDCLGLVRGVWRTLYGCEPVALPSYTPDWAEASGCETLLEAARKHLIPVDIAKPKQGDILLFRLKQSLPAKHVAILGSTVTMIHAVEHAPVSEVPFSQWWQRRLAGVFSFPGVAD